MLKNIIITLLIFVIGLSLNTAFGQTGDELRIELDLGETRIEVLERKLRENPQDSVVRKNYLDTLINQGINLRKSGKYEEALEIYDKLIKEDPTFAIAWNNKGVVLHMLENYKAAANCYDSAISIDPEFRLAWKNKGNASYNLAEYDDAVKAYQKVTHIDPYDVQAWGFMGRALYKLGRYEEAKIAFEKEIYVNPRGAIETYKKTVELHPDSAFVYSDLGELFFKLGNLDSASIKVKDALSRDSNLVSALKLKGRIEIEEQEYDSAAASFNKAIALNPGDPLLLLWHSYAKYLEAEFSLDSSDLTGKEYREKILSIIRELERAEKLSREYEEKEAKASIVYFLSYSYYKIKNIFTGQEKRELERIEKSIKNHQEAELHAHILYFLACFYYRSKDVFTAKAKLEECIQLRSSIKTSATELLNYIWDYQIRPSWWRWWWYSPIYKNTTRPVFVVVMGFILLLFLVHPFVSKWFYDDRSHYLRINWTLYISFVALLIIFLLSPRIARIRAKDIEVELRSPPSFEFVPFPARMEEKIPGLDALPEQ